MKLGKKYLRGVGVGLIISWVTGALAYFHTGMSLASVFQDLIELELVLSIIFLATSYVMRGEE